MQSKELAKNSDPAPAKRLGASWLLLLLSVAAFGQDDGGPSSERPAFGCSSNVSAQDMGFIPSRHFPEIQEHAVAVSILFCEALNNPVSRDLPTRELAEFGLFVESRASQKFAGTAEQDGVAEAMRLFARTIDAGDAFPLQMPDFDVGKPSSEGTGIVVFYSVSIAMENLFEVTPTDDESCEPVHAIPCSALLLDLSEAINPYKRSYQISNAETAKKQLTELHEQWDSFFEKARAMTTLDLALTTFMEREHMRQGYLVGPVERQWFALHPNLILQYTDASLAGERFEPGLSLEWIGVNYWSGGPFGIPIGASLVTVYSDRPEIDQVGHGVNLHFDNQFTIGWTRHGSDNAFHLSMDLLRLFEEKQSEFEQYKQRVLTLR